MIQAADFVEPALARGYRFWTGVPCSFLTPFINYVISDPKLSYVGAASEGEAVGVAFGAHLAGAKTVVICQNSGLGNTVNPLTSLNFPFKVPTLLITTHRGAPGLKDEPQHELMGQITGELLDAMRIPWKVFPDRAEDVAAALDEADRYMAEKSLPYALLMKKGAVAPFPLKASAAPAARAAAVSGSFSTAKRLPRLEAIKLVAGLLRKDDLVVATTGKIGRELHDLGHRPGQLYVVGGMGCASAIGLGAALNRPERRVVVLDGDGAALMKLGALGTIGHYRPANLVHVVLDNEAHESTGAQATCSSTVDFAAVAAACSYASARRADTSEALTAAVKTALTEKGPSFIHMKVGVGSAAELGRPTVTPLQVKEQFIECLKAPI
ncbi:MAG: phosphonopyruvate decarboxylase [Elusimicrobiota bacterium]|nr:MAG: phosphonopyruvate decarboxylase [Elusimicrobiota bacterium]